LVRYLRHIGAIFFNDLLLHNRSLRKTFVVSISSSALKPPPYLIVIFEETFYGKAPDICLDFTAVYTILFFKKNLLTAVVWLIQWSLRDV